MVVHYRWQYPANHQLVRLVEYLLLYESLHYRLVTFLVKDADWRETANIVDNTQIARIAPSLGGVESLIEQPLVMSYYECTPEERRQFGIPDNMIRMSCGIENAEDLIADLEQALKK